MSIDPLEEYHKALDALIVHGGHAPIANQGPWQMERLRLLSLVRAWRTILDDLRILA